MQSIYKEIHPTYPKKKKWCLRSSGDIKKLFSKKKINNIIIQKRKS